MTSGADFPSIPKVELLARLAAGHAARVAVVTPNQRLAAAVVLDFDAHQIARGLGAWEAADILPLSAWVERAYEDALYSELATRLPILLSAAQEQALWEEIVRGSEAGGALLSVPPAAALAREAWQLAHAWRLAPRLKGYPANDDARAFADWAWRYEGITQRDRHCDRARLADVVMPHLAHAALRKPATLIAYGFDILNAQQRELFAALAQADVQVLACGPEVREARARRAAFTSRKDEIRAAASWARAKLEAAHSPSPQPLSRQGRGAKGEGARTPLAGEGRGAQSPLAGEGRGAQSPLPPGGGGAGGEGEASRPPRIGIVVPDLAQSRRAVQRIFSQVMAPAHGLPGTEQHPLPFNISLGEPLSSYPLVAAAMLALDLARTATAGEIEFAGASRLIRSPFIAGAEAELAQRARLDAELRKLAGVNVSLERLLRLIEKIASSGHSPSPQPLSRQGRGAQSPLRSEGRGTQSPLRSEGRGAQSPLRSEGRGTQSPLRSEGRGTQSPLPPGGGGAGGEGVHCPKLTHRLTELSKFSRENLHGSKRASEWGKAIATLLDEAGFPGERTLDSAEYQTLEKLHEAIAGFAALDRVAPRMRFAEACARFARLCADTLFQPEAPQVPIQVLGVLESAGLEFDHLWVMGLTDEAWPIPARPNPFIPVALQRASGVPEASAAASLELDARITRGWLAASGEVVLSHPLREDDRELVPSALIRDIPECQVLHPLPNPSPVKGEGLNHPLGVKGEGLNHPSGVKGEGLNHPSGVKGEGFDHPSPLAGEGQGERGSMALALPEYESLRDAIRRARREERLPDACGPALAQAVISSGGTGVFKDQAACPFKAFALRRLGAEGIEEPPTGLDAADRGTLLHAMLAKIWQELKSKARLDAIGEGELDALLARAAEHAINRLRWFRPYAIAGRYMELEQVRLAKLGRAWLEIERARADFEVVETERKREVSFGGVTVNAKLDRMDRLEDGSHAILDYKTGAASVGDWLGPRPEDPQLPLYAVSQGDTEGAGEVSAVAFARVKAGEMGFKGIARSEGLIPGVGTIAKQRSAAAKDYESWEQLLGGWRYELETLGQAYAAGDARVDPKRDEETCRYCDLKPLCRINERSPSPQPLSRQGRGADTSLYSEGRGTQSPLPPGGGGVGGEGAGGNDR
jgi:RecB family exonuclease